MKLRDYAKFNPSTSHRSSAAVTIGAATLADIYDPAVRGKKVGINIKFLSMSDFFFEDGNLLHCTTAWTSNSYLV